MMEVPALIGADSEELTMRICGPEGRVCLMCCLCEALGPLEVDHQLGRERHCAVLLTKQQQKQENQTPTWALWWETRGILKRPGGDIVPAFQAAGAASDSCSFLWSILGGALDDYSIAPCPMTT